MKRHSGERTAYDEAGHIAVAIAQGMKLVSATIAPSGNRKGCVQWPARQAPRNPDLLRAFLEKEILFRLAGPVAERMFSGKSVGVKRDDREVDELVDCLYSDPDVAEAFLLFLLARVSRFLAHHWDLVKALAQALIAHGTLTNDQIVKVVLDVDAEILPGPDSDKELERALQAFLAEGETEVAKAFVNGWNSARFLKESDLDEIDPQ